MFAPVWQTYRDHLVFAAALLAYLVVVAPNLVVSKTWGQLLPLPLLGALPFLALPMLRRFLPLFLALVLGGAGLLAAGELLFRSRYLGAEAVSAFTSYSPLPVTVMPGFLSPSEDPELRFLFTPGAEGVFNGKSWKINEAGFRDDPLPGEKAPGVYRILITGDSFVLGAGVEVEERFSSQLERLLDRPEAGRPVELLNLALMGANLREVGHLIETYGPRYRADLALVGLRANQLHATPAVRDDAARELARGRGSPYARFSFVFRHSFLLNVVREPVSAGLNRASSLLRTTLGRSQAAAGAPAEEMSEFERLVARCAAFTRREGIPAALVVLRKMEFDSDLGLRAALADRALGGDASRRSDHTEIARIAAEAGVPVIDTYDAFAQDAKRSDYIIYPGDGHPNPAGHQRYAETIAAWLRDNAYLPGG